MTTRTLSYSITLGGNSVTDLLSCSVAEGFNQATSRFEMEMRTLPSCDVNSDVSITFGFTGSTALVFTGKIDNIEKDNPPGVIRVTGRDALKRAQEHLLVPSAAQEPAFSRTNISAEALVQALLAECGLTNYGSDASGFTFFEPEFSLEFVYGAIEQICGIIQWHCYADTSGKVWFKDIQPEPSGASSKTFNSGVGGNLTLIRYRKSDSDLRNKVIVFGKDEIQASASASSPYVPSGYYKTAVVASPLIDTQAMADGAATYNLAAWNKLLEAVEGEAEGDPTVHARQTVTVTETWTGINENWFVHNCTHRFGPNNYVMDLTLTK